MTTPTRPASDIAYLCRALKAPSPAQAFGRLAERARQEEWSYLPVTRPALGRRHGVR